MGPLVVIGDTLLDVDVEGDIDRLCPDAPVPVVDVAAEHARPGGAGLAALLAARDGAEVVLITAIGDDPAGRRLCGLLSDELDLVRLPLRGGTVRKTRIRVRGQTLLRVDTGDGTVDQVREHAKAAEAVARAGAVLVADYGRGVARLARALLPGRGVPIVWDPHPRGDRPMAGCTLLTPNEAEAELLRPGPYPGPDRAARHLARVLRAQAVAVTLGARGAALALADGSLTQIPAPVRATGLDVCGAGDRLASAAALALRAGANVKEAVTLRVGEASRFVERGGAAALRVQEQRLGDRPRTAVEAAEPLRPDAWVKGDDHEGGTLPESEVLDRLGAETVVLRLLPGRSTTHLIREIR